MGYLLSQDYKLPIQDKELSNLITTDPIVKGKAEVLALEEIASWLKQRYDLVSEFTDSNVFSMLASYKAANLVEINFPAYDATKTYTANVDLVIQAGNGYVCKTTIIVPEAFTVAHWTLLGAQYDLFYVSFPQTPFNYLTCYKKGTQVFWKNKVYTCLVDTVIPDHFSTIQYPSYSSIPLYNVFPDDPINGLINWGAGVAYSVAAGTLPTDATKWTKGDNRSQQVVNYAVKIAIYHLCFRISPQNVPAHRKAAYEEALAWLAAVSQGNVNADLPEIQPSQGSPIMSGGQVKRINQW